jgi:type VI secretion system protein ImpF
MTMPDLAPAERLQPALLDRLTDDAPDKKEESVEKRVISKTKLRQAVLRDLAWLFNAVAPIGVNWEIYPFASHSVLNFGLPPLSGETSSTVDVLDLENALRQALIDFEPRILPATLKVETIQSDSQLDSHNVIRVRIHADLWAQPVPLEFLVQTDVDLETGEVSIREFG